MSHWHLRKGPRKFKPAPAARHFAPRAPERAVGGGTATQPDLLDGERAGFIRALDGATFDLPEWEAEFTGSMFQRVEKRLPLTDKMRLQIDRLMRKYPQFTGREKLKPVRSTTREAYVPDEAAALLSRGRGRAGGQGR